MHLPVEQPATFLKQAREKLGISQESLARELGVSFATVNRWERGHSKPSRIAQTQIEVFLKEKPTIQMGSPKSSPLPMQYLGSKSRISGWIISEIKNSFPNCNKLFDLFSGTGTIALAAKNAGYEVGANDFELYSYSLIESLLATPREGIETLVTSILEIKEENRLLANGRKGFKQLFLEEKNFFSDQLEISWKNYKAFCESTPLISDPDKINALGEANRWNLFCNYYANTYFGVKQCLQLDALRELAENLPVPLRNHLMAATISSMSYGVSSTTHLAQYLRPDSRSRALHLVKRRQFDFIANVCQRLTNLKDYGMPQKRARVFNLEFKELLKDCNFDKNWVVYADPPYFKEHYSRYYHVLNTFLLYDYPYLTLNAQTSSVTEGRYRHERNISNFGKKSTVENAFYDLFSLCCAKQTNLALSYAETSLVGKKTLLKIAKQAGMNCKVAEKVLLHSGQGQPRNKKVTEYLFLLNPII